MNLFGFWDITPCGKGGMGYGFAPVGEEVLHNEGDDGESEEEGEILHEL